MAVVRDEEMAVRGEEEIVRIRQAAREWAIALGFGLVDQTKIVTAASELARNTVIYGGGGSVRFQSLSESGRTGLRLVFEDKGPGIPDIPLALKDGYTTGTGLGLGLSGARRLMSEFDIKSTPGQGTRVTITRWK
jgi:serine/threonine-protein kinase RsbT